MTIESKVVVQLARDGAVDRQFQTDAVPDSIVSGQVALDHIEGDPGGVIGPPPAGQVILSVLSPESLRDSRLIHDVLARAKPGGEPLVITVDAAEYLREDELAAVLDAAGHAGRLVIVRILADA
ncbi:MAG TPA: hypothetical protein VGH27_08220 [Streptosporangiaceae bacterium]|jgi:hypothetical protein